MPALQTLQLLASICTRCLLLLTAASSIPIASADISFWYRSASAQVEFSGESYGASFGDLNGDGYPDIYASNHRYQDALDPNMHNGTNRTLVFATRTVRRHPPKHPQISHQPASSGLPGG